MAKTTQYWLMKSEPEVYSIDDFKKDKSTLWTGVRNYQARNFMMGEVPDKPGPFMQAGDLFLFYHSNATPPACAGVGRIEKTGVPDPEQFDKKNEYFEPKATETKPIWFCAKVKYIETLKKLVPLEEIRREKALSKMTLIQKGSRLSVQPVTKEEFDHILKMSQA
ncbi:MAG: EVE domain-containing protein [Bdellovibrionales bacterium]|jgi:predicted RNA-binding protein with PUA-like domain|nr:EVE domain-containing protein [Bdellovibrionales bacterium]